MAFSQVIEDKNSPTGKSLVRLSGATDAGSAAAMAVAQEAKQTADAALPKAGGEMSGPIKVFMGEPITGANGQRGYISLGGSDKQKLVDLLCNYYKSAGSDNGAVTAFVRALNPLAENAFADLTVSVSDDGTTFARAPATQDSYDNRIATSKYVKDIAILALPFTDWHVGGAGESDTADLFNGRGSEDKPFSTLPGCLYHLCSRYGSRSAANIVLHKDVSLTGYIHLLALLPRVTITSDTTLRTITLSGVSPINVLNGTLGFQNVNFQVDNVEEAFKVSGGYGPCQLIFGGNIAINGTITGATMTAINGGNIYIQPEATLSGTVTGGGKKYAAYNGSRIFLGGHEIPGSVAGVYDSHSNVF